MKALILMTRVPVPGKTKTRLMEVLTANQCAEIHKCFLLDLFNIFKLIKDDIDIYLTYTPEDSFNVMKKMVPNYINAFPQSGENLGSKMSNAIKFLLDKGYSKVCLMGSDIPDIQPKEIKDAFDSLEDSDICIGPTCDGGYYFIGMKKFIEDIFHSQINWGRKTVFEGTVDIANNQGLKVSYLNQHRDIDTKEDLIAFKDNIVSVNYIDKIRPINTINYINKFWSDIGYAKE